MTIPSIPTDNLYKFVFVSGLILMGASVLLYVNKSIDIDNELNSIDLEVVNAKNKFYRDSLLFDLEGKYLQDLITNDSSRVNQIDKWIKNKEEFTDEKIEEIEGQVLKTKDKFWETKRNSIERRASSNSYSNLIEYRLQRQKKEIRNMIFLGVICLIGFIFGLRLTIRGYNDWYKKLQKPMDEKFKYELEKLKSND